MSSIKKNIAARRATTSGKGYGHNGAYIAIVLSEYNAKRTGGLRDSCVKELKKAGITDKQIKIISVPGAWELPFACQTAAKKKPSVVIALGCIIKGGTPHFDFIASAVAQGIMDASLKTNVPIVFGVLTTNNLAQAKARIDKGTEAAQTAISLLK